MSNEEVEAACIVKFRDATGLDYAIAPARMYQTFRLGYMAGRHDESEVTLKMVRDIMDPTPKGRGGHTPAEGLNHIESLLKS